MARQLVSAVETLHVPDVLKKAAGRNSMEHMRSVGSTEQTKSLATTSRKSLRGFSFRQRRRPDSNRGITDLQSVALSHLATAP